MDPTRKARLESVIQEEIARLVAREVKDPRVGEITVTRVEVTRDGGFARVFVIPFGGPREPEEIKGCVAGLNSAAGFLKRRLAKALELRSIPALQFQEDRGLDNAMRVHSILKDIKKNGGSDEA